MVYEGPISAPVYDSQPRRIFSRRTQPQNPAHSSSPPQHSSMPNVLQRTRSRSNPSKPPPTHPHPPTVSTSSTSASSSSTPQPRVPLPVLVHTNPDSAALHTGYQHLNTSQDSLLGQSKKGPDAGGVSSIHNTDNEWGARASSTSSSGHGHGGSMRRSISRKMPPPAIATTAERGPEGGARGGLEADALPTTSIAFPAPTPAFASQGQGPHHHPPPSPTLSVPPPRLSSLPSPLSTHPRTHLLSSSPSPPHLATTTSNATTGPTTTMSATQRRKPSLASPLPPTPLVPPSVSTPLRPKSFAASTSRSPPAPLNLSAPGGAAAAGAVGVAGEYVRSHYHSLPGPHSPMGGTSVSPHPSPHRPDHHSLHLSHSQHPSPHPSPHSHPHGHGHSSHSHHPHSSSPPSHTHVPAPAPRRSSISLSNSPPVHFPSPPALSSSPTTAPDSPSARAMMKRLLSKPAPPSSSGGSAGGTPTSAVMHFGSSPGCGAGGVGGWMSATSGSESEGAYGWYSYRRRKDLGRMFGVGDGTSSPALQSPSPGRPISPGDRNGAAPGLGQKQAKGWKSEPEDTGLGVRRRGRGGGGGLTEESHVGLAEGIEFDMNLEKLDRGIATLGLGVVHGPGYSAEGGVGGGVGSPQEREKGKEKEKKQRNVLRRRPSANLVSPSSNHSTAPNAHRRSVSGKILSQNARNAPPPPSNTQLQPNQAPTVLLPPTSPLSPMSFSIAKRSSPSEPAFEQTQSLRPPLASSSLSRSSSRSGSDARSHSRSRGSSPVRSPVVSTIHGSGPSSGSATPVIGGMERKRSREGRLERIESRDGRLERNLERKSSREKGGLLRRKVSKETDGEKAKPLTPAASLIEQYKARQATREDEERRIGEALEREAAVERARERERWERERAIERAAGREEKERLRALERETRERRDAWERGMGHQRRRSRSHPAPFTSTSTMANTSAFSSNTHLKAMTSFNNLQSGYAGPSSIYTHAHSDFAGTNTRANMMTASNRLTVEHDTEAEASDSGVSHIQLALRGGTPAPEAVLGGGRGFERIERIAGLEEHERQVEEMVRGRQDVNEDAKRPEEDRRASQNPGERKEDESASPYYTVFGSTSGRVVAVGSVEDSWDAYGRLGNWDSGLFGKKGTGSLKEKDKDHQLEKETERSGEKEKAKGLGRTLSRRVSERWRKPGTVMAPTSVMSDDGHGSHREEVERKRQDLSLAGRLPRASMQERRVLVRRQEDLEMGQEREKREKLKSRRSLRLSIDKFADAVDRAEERDVASLARTLSKQKSAGAMRNDASSPGSPSPGRLWKLMRRISVGGLREKYQDLEAPPPVPALPHHIREATHSNDSLLKQPPSQRSPSLGSPSPSPTPVRQSPTIGLTARPSPPQSKSTSTPAPSQPRPSTNTRSSSPVSSDVASSKFFNRTHSPHSSTSSLGEEVPPPVPKPPSSIFAQKIIPPSKMDEINEECAAALSSPALHIPAPSMPSTDGDWAIVNSPPVELPSLTLPPRRPQQGFLGAASSSSSLKPPSVTPTSAGTAAFGTPDDDELDRGRSASPIIPSFSTSNTVDTLPARRLSAALSAKSKNSPISPHPQSPSFTNAFPVSVPPPTSPTSLPPPPRPLRSAQRPVPGTMASRGATAEQPIGEPTHNFPIPDPAKRNRRSSGGASTLSTATARPRPRSTSIGMSRSFDAPRSHLSSSSASVISSYASIRSGTSTLDLESAMEMGGRAAFTFRELGSQEAVGRRALTEQEKAARWDDLLERSDRAGGTLHLGGEGRLASDRLRF